jgi:hypothetical protein
MVIIMSFSAEKLQLLINAVYAIAFCVIVIPMTYILGLPGIAYGLVIVNLVRFGFTMILGMKKLNKIKKGLRNDN